MAIKKDAQVVPANAETPTTNGETEKPKRGPKKGSKRGPVGPILRFNDNRDAALYETLFILQDSGNLTTSAVVEALQIHPAFEGETTGKNGETVATASLLDSTNVKAAITRVHEKLSADETTKDLADAMPQVEDNRKRGVPVDKFREILAARRA